MDPSDLARFVENILIELTCQYDRNGLKIVLPRDYQIAILASAITALVGLSHKDIADLVGVSLGDLTQEAN